MTKTNKDKGKSALYGEVNRSLIPWSPDTNVSGVVLSLPEYGEMMSGIETI